MPKVADRSEGKVKEMDRGLSLATLRAQPPGDSSWDSLPPNARRGAGVG